MSNILYYVVAFANNGPYTCAYSRFYYQYIQASWRCIKAVQSYMVFEAVKYVAKSIVIVLDDKQTMMSWLVSDGLIV